MYDEVFKIFRNAIAKIEIKEGQDLAEIFARRLVIYKMGELKMWWNSNIFSHEGFLYMKSMFPNTFKINMLLVAMRTAQKKENELFQGQSDIITFYNLTDELENSLTKIISSICTLDSKSMDSLVGYLVDSNDVESRDDIFSGIKTKEPQNINPPKIYFGQIDYQSLFSNNQANFKELNTYLQPLLMGYQNSEQKSLSVGYYSLV